MHRSRHPIDIATVVVDDDDDEDNDEEISNHQLISSTTTDYSSLMVDSPSDSSSHRHPYAARSPSPIPGSQSTSLRSTHRRLSYSTTQIDSNASTTNVHRERLRFNTWPRHRKEKCDILAEHDKRLAKTVIQELGIGINKTYRNPWGNLSYAQLITRAIDSSPWKRLTLNEVYEWIIKFVPYFKDKIDAKTSWGWKNSIRHNLSLHNQFIRVPIISSLSKGPVKYVWTINPSFKNNSPYKKYSLKRKRAAAAAAAAAAAGTASNTSNGHVPSSSSRSPPDQNSEYVAGQSSGNPSNHHHYHHRHPTQQSLPKATRIHEQVRGNGSSQASASATLNQLSVAAAMMSAGVTDPASYRAFLNSQAAMMNNPKQSTGPSSSLSHESGLPVPKKLALASDRQKQQHAEWLLSSYRQQSQAYNNSNRPYPHPSEPNKLTSHQQQQLQQQHQRHQQQQQQQQQRSLYLPPVPPPSNARASSEINHLSPSLQRRVSSPSNYPPSAANVNQSKLLAQTKLWHAAVQAATQAQQQYHQQSSPNNGINDLQHYINRAGNNNGHPNKLPSYPHPEMLKHSPSKPPVDEHYHYNNHPRYKLMRASYPNAANGSLLPTCLIRQAPHPTSSPSVAPPPPPPPPQSMDMLAAAYQNYRRRSSGFSSTTSHGGASDDDTDEYPPPRKDSSTSNASSGYESGLAPHRQSSPVSSSIRTGSGSSITSDASSSSCHYNPGNGHHLPKLNVNSQEIELDERQTPVGGYVDDLMERIRKMPPKKRSKFYQMLDEERLKDVNNNHPKSQSKLPLDDEDDDHDSLTIDTSTNALIITEAVSDDEEDRTLSESLPQSRTMKTPANKSMAGLNESSYEELRAMGVPLTVLKALAYQQQHPSEQPKGSRFNKCSVSSNQPSASENQRLLNARTILRHILQQQQQQQASQEKSSAEPMDYSSDDEGDRMEDEIAPHRSSATSTPRHRHLIRSNSHNPLNVMLNPNDISSLSPPTSTSSSPDDTDVQHQPSPTSISRPSSTPATLVSSACLF